MSGANLIHSRIRAGVWEGRLSVQGAAPAVGVTHLERPIDGVSLTPVPDTPDQYLLRVPIPPETLSDGVQTFLVLDTGSGARLGHFTIVAGTGLEDDIRAEIDLLRAELDMLKKAFRRHCLETS